MKICFRENNFEYVIIYSVNDNMINITCTHIEEYYTWQCTIADNISSNDEELKNSIVSIKLTPKKTFELIKNYHDHCLNSIYSFKFPEKIKSPTSKLVIEFITRLPAFDEHDDIKVIFLEPLIISDSDRFNNKLLNLEEKFMKQIKILKNDNDIMNNKLSELQNLVDESKQVNNFLMQTLQTLATKQELNTFVKKTEQLVPKQELNMFVKKTEQSLVTREELSMLIKKIESLVTKEELNMFAKKTDVVTLTQKRNWFGNQTEIKNNSH